jgi:hypothetical protein
MAGSGRLRAQWNEALLQLVVAPAYLELLTAAAAMLGPGVQYNRCGGIPPFACCRHASLVTMGIIMLVCCSNKNACVKQVLGMCCGSFPARCAEQSHLACAVTACADAGDAVQAVAIL